MDYEWDAEKSDWTRRERGFGFEIMKGFDWSLAACLGIQSVETEERELWIGPVNDHLHAVVITERDANTRIISLRHATQAEIDIWRKEFHNG